jgi:predicted XRE-type DNA-binding protein
MATKKLLIEKSGGNVFADLGFDAGEAHNLRLRAELMIRIERFVKANGLTQAEAARRLGTTQPRINALLRGRIDEFSLDALVLMVVRCGPAPEWKFRKAA